MFPEGGRVHLGRWDYSGSGKPAGETDPDTGSRTVDEGVAGNGQRQWFLCKGGGDTVPLP